jgi:transcriptional regulator with XRE-family HTH domain
MNKAIRLLHAGKSPKEVAGLCGVSIRTVHRWAQDKEVDLQALELQEKALVASDPVVQVVTDGRAQVEEILTYRDSQRNFALQMGLVVQKSTGILLKAVERLEQNPDEISARTLPQLMRAVTDASEKISNAWKNATGLDILLEKLGDEQPKIIGDGSKETPL